MVAPVQIFNWLAGIVGVTLTILGLVDIPEQLGKWGQLMVAMDLTGDRGRWILVIVGIFIVFVANGGHRKLYAHHIVSRSPQDERPRGSDLKRLGISDYFYRPARLYFKATKGKSCDGSLCKSQAEN